MEREGSTQPIKQIRRPRRSKKTVIDENDAAAVASPKLTLADDGTPVAPPPSTHLTSKMKVIGVRCVDAPPPSVADDDKKQVVEPPELFVSLSGWFIKSPFAHAASQAWLEAGGEVTIHPTERAPILFSDQPNDTDTKRFQSGDHPSLVYHPAWIMDSIKAGHRLPMGKYILTPQHYHHSVNDFFQRRRNLPIGRDGRPLPYQGQPSSEEHKSKESGGSDEQVGEEETKKKRRRRSKPDAATGGVSLAPTIDLAATSPSPSPVASSASAYSSSYQLPSNSPFYQYMNGLAQKPITQIIRTPIILNSNPTTVPTNQPTPTPEPILAAAPTPAVTSTKKKGAKRKAVTEPPPSTESSNLAVPPIASSTAAHSIPHSTSALVTANSTLPSNHHQPSMPRPNLFATHWIRQRSPVDLTTLLPYAAPTMSSIIQTQVELPELESAAAVIQASKRGRKKKGAKAAAELLVDEVKEDQVMAPLDEEGEELIDLTTAQPPKKKRKQLIKEEPMDQTAAPEPSASSAFQPSLSSLNISASDFDKAEAVMNESSIRALKNVASLLGLSTEGDFAQLRTQPEWQQEFKNSLVHYWATIPKQQ